MSEELRPEPERPAGEQPESEGPQEELTAPRETSDAQVVTGDPPEDETRDALLPFLIVALGASAGGIEAYRELFSNLGEGTGMAYIVASHLHPSHKSHLASVLQACTPMPVVTIENGMKPVPDRVHVVPPNVTVTFDRGVIRLGPFPETRPRTMLIDTLFRSLAEDQKGRAIGVVLSGSDADGALGLKAIKEEGGISIVQSPESARFPSMPMSSIDADHVDLCLPPGEIALELMRIAEQFRTPEVRLLKDGQPPPTEDQQVTRILLMLRNFAGVDFRQYKPTTLRRRIARRIMLKRFSSLDEYVRVLASDQGELATLHEDVLINVTQFFRDPDVFEVLKSEVFPRVIDSRPANQPVRIWVAGCSTGEEAYSTAIALLEFIGNQSIEPTIQIFGTDASERSIEKARMGIYPENISADVTPERLQRFFTRVDRGYQVNKRVRDLCIFARQNLCSDPPFSKLDLVSCRNVLIYFGTNLQRTIIPIFHYALRPNGYLLLGSSETIREFSDMFSLADRKHKIYSKISSSSAPTFDLPVRVAAPEPSRLRSLFHGGRPSWTETDLARAADRVVVSRYGPPGVVINERLEILQSRGHTAPYIEMAPGAASLHLLRMVRDSLAIPVRDAVQRAIDEDVPVTLRDVPVDSVGSERVDIEVLPIVNLSARPRCFLVLFTPIQEAEEAPAPQSETVSDEVAPEHDRRIAQLQQDLSSTKLYLQSLIEDREAKNQELISANEEIQSANEELQSTNEELETAKEELQSANEELQTVNDELSQRNVVLAQTKDDLTNLLLSVNIPLLMLSSDLHIRQFTPPAQRFVNLRGTDIGRPIGEVKLKIDVPDLEPMLRNVLDTLTPHEREIQDEEGRAHLLKVRPYRTAENKIEGVVLVLLDVDQFRKNEMAMLEARDFADAILKGVSVPIVVLDSAMRIRSANSAFLDLAGITAEELETRPFLDWAERLWGVPGLRGKVQQKLLNDSAHSSFDFEHETRASGQTLHFHGQHLRAGTERVVLLTIEDLTERRTAERITAREKERLEGQIETTTETLERTREELRALAAGLFSSQEEERKHVARELHDDISQRVAALDMQLAQLESGLPERPEQIRQALSDFRNQVRAVSDDVRAISHRLHPSMLEDLGLTYALQSLVEEIEQRSQMVATFVVQNVPEHIPIDIAAALYRIAQEALRNVEKHAGRTHVKVILSEATGLLKLEVADLGEGFDMARVKKGLGLISMQERARLVHGTVSIHSLPGKGTTITVAVPSEMSAGAHNE